MGNRLRPNKGQCAHITIRCINKDFFFNLKHDWDDYVSWVDCIPFNFKISLHHVLFMSNHIHLLVTPQEHVLGDAMRYFLTNLAKFMNHRNGRINHVFANRYYASIIRKESHLMNVIRYLYQNPVRAGIVEKITDYPYSSLGFYLGYNNYGLKLYPDSVTKEYWKQTLVGRDEWLKQIQTNYTTVEAGIVKQSLKRRTFRFSREQLTSIQKHSTTIAI